MLRSRITLLDLSTPLSVKLFIVCCTLLLVLLEILGEQTGITLSTV